MESQTFQSYLMVVHAEDLDRSKEDITIISYLLTLKINQLAAYVAKQCNLIIMSLGADTVILDLAEDGNGIVVSVTGTIVYTAPGPFGDRVQAMQRFARAWVPEYGTPPKTVEETRGVIIVEFVRTGQ